MIRLYYTCFSTPLPTSVYEKYFNYLPVEEKVKISRFKHWQDAHRCLLGKALLIEGLIDIGLSSDLVQDLKKSPYGRPYIISNQETKLDFNIAHAGNYVLCAVSTKCRIGVDIEKIKPVDMDEFENIITYDDIQSFNNPLNIRDRFFKIWAIKEAIGKLDGRGLGYPYDKLRLCEEYVFSENQLFFYKEINLSTEYKSVVAWDKHGVQIAVQKLSF